MMRVFAAVVAALAAPATGMPVAPSAHVSLEQSLTLDAGMSDFTGVGGRPLSSGLAGHRH